MAASEIDQKFLGRLSEETAVSNPLLSSALYQVLGLSVILSRKLLRARKLRRLDPSRDTKSMSLYHHIIWLSREGLSITEVYILPYSQNGGSSPHCRVMAAKLRASFYHVFCLFHNHPPLSLASPTGNSPPSGPLTPRTSNGQNIPRRSPTKNERDRKAALRDAIPSMTSEVSYITNPYANEGPAQTPPPSYPVPPIPTGTPTRRTLTRPPGLNVPSKIQGSPPSSANFLLPPLNFVPAATAYFSTATLLARDLLSGSDPLRLSVALEHSAFLWDCARDFDGARKRSKHAIRAVYAATEGMNDSEFQDAAMLVQALGHIAQRGTTGTSTPSPDKRTEVKSTITRKSVANPVARPPSKTPTGNDATERSRKTPTADGTLQRPGVSHLPDAKAGLSGTQGRSTTLVDSSATGSNTAIDSQGRPFSTDSVKRSRANQNTKTRRHSPADHLNDKEKKRRLVERAEEEVIRRNSAKSSSAGGSRQTTPPGVVAERLKGQENITSKDFVDRASAR